MNIQLYFDERECLALSPRLRTTKMFLCNMFRPKKDKIRRAPQFPDPAPDRSGI